MYQIARKHLKGSITMLCIYHILHKIILNVNVISGFPCESPLQYVKLIKHINAFSFHLRLFLKPLTKLRYFDNSSFNVFINYSVLFREIEIG